LITGLVGAVVLVAACGPGPVVGSGADTATPRVSDLPVALETAGASETVTTLSVTPSPSPERTEESQRDLQQAMDDWLAKDPEGNYVQPVNNSDRLYNPGLRSVRRLNDTNDLPNPTPTHYYSVVFIGDYVVDDHVVLEVGIEAQDNSRAILAVNIGSVTKNTVLCEHSIIPNSPPYSSDSRAVISSVRDLPMTLAAEEGRVIMINLSSDSLDTTFADRNNLDAESASEQNPLAAVLIPDLFNSETAAQLQSKYPKIIDALVSDQSFSESAIPFAAELFTQ
jgi:hypothetical protein